MSLPSAFASAVLDCVSKYPLLHDVKNAPLTYGTAGFRTTGAMLPPVGVRVIFVAVLRVWWAICTRKRNEDKDNISSATSGCSVGCMITASHNPSSDNGLKLIDIDGQMLTTSWETICTAAANATTGKELLAELEAWMTMQKICVPTNDEYIKFCPFGAVHFARDTRPSGEKILYALKNSMQTMCVSFSDHGVTTTPQLHYLVERANRPSSVTEISRAADFGTALYNRDILSSLGELLQVVAASAHVRRRRQTIVVDAANGVGAIALKSLLSALQETSRHPLEEFLDIVILHDDVEDHCSLNEMCGADFTQKTRSPSNGMKRWAAAHEEQRLRGGNGEEIHYYSLDGDADRVVAFFHDQRTDGAWHLLDGDRMAILYALALRKWIGPDGLQSLDVGVVQTAYANGASTEYLQRHLGLRVYSAATGVKHLHPMASQRDIGLYFEANGHGTVLFGSDVFASKFSCVDSQSRAILKKFSLLFSQVCGDGIADVFACEVMLLALEMSFSAWYSIYKDLPSVQSKVTVSNPKIITNTSDERRALTPPGLQEAIDAAVNAASSSSIISARAFVRPSGTEQLVRVYAEAEDATACTMLATEVERLVKQYCDPE